MKKRIFIFTIFALIVAGLVLYFQYPATSQVYDVKDPACDHPITARHPILIFIKLEFDSVCELPPGWERVSPLITEFTN